MGEYHRVTVGENFEAKAGRLASGHVHISAKINQGTDLVSRSAAWVKARWGDDEPGHTTDVDVLYRDVNEGGAGSKGDGGAEVVAQQVGNAVGKEMVDSQAETVCAKMTNANNQVEMTTEWYIRAGDGTSGTTLAGACDRA